MSRVKKIRSRPAFNCSWQRETWFSSHISSDAASVRNIFIPSFRSWLAALLSCVFPTRNYSKLHSLWLHSSERGGRNEVIRQSNRSERRFNQANGKLGSGMLPVFFSIRTHTGWLCARLSPFNVSTPMFFCPKYWTGAAGKKGRSLNAKNQPGFSFNGM